MVGLDIKDKKFGYLTPIELIPEDSRINSYKRREWLCLCDCGNKCIVEQRFLTNINKQHIISCGCIRKKAHLIATSGCKWLTLDYLLQFKDWDKFAFLHKQLIKNIKLPDLTEEQYFSYIEKFYNEKQFNNIYNTWKEKEKSETFYDLYKPSLDHIIPKSKGGSNTIDNFQFLTLYENLAKRDMTQTEWENFKRVNHCYSDLFIGGDA